LDIESAYKLDEMKLPIILGQLIRNKSWLEDCFNQILLQWIYLKIVCTYLT